MLCLRAMNRRRRSSCQNWKSPEIPKIGEEDDTVIWSRFGTDIPVDIFTDIALRLPVKSILACRCVCKTWRQRVSDSEFAELHFKTAQQSIILRSTAPSHVSRTLYLLEPQHYFNYTCHDESRSEEQIGMKLDTKLKIPLRYHKLMLDGRLESLAKANSKGRVEGRRLIATKPLQEDKYLIVNSCNGLLCLSEPETDDLVAVCNPVTGEYTQLMGSSNLIKESLLTIGGGLGFCSSTNQYKVVRIYRVSSRYKFVAEVQTLGLGSWKEVTIGYDPEYYFWKCTTYVSGNVYWLSFARGVDSHGKHGIFLFNMENEQFGSVSLPKRNMGPDFTTMGALHNQIYICHVCYNSHQILIWLMNDDGAKSAWEMVFSVDNEDRWPYYGLYYPMKLYENGAVLIFHTSGGLIYHDPKECGFKYFRIQGSNPKFEAIAYVPSFISLQKQIIGDYAVVQNVISRCAQFKLQEEELEVYMRNDDIYAVKDSANTEYNQLLWNLSFKIAVFGETLQRLS